MTFALPSLGAVMTCSGGSTRSYHLIKFPDQGSCAQVDYYGWP